MFFPESPKRKMVNKILDPKGNPEDRAKLARALFLALKK